MTGCLLTSHPTPRWYRLAFIHSHPLLTVCSFPSFYPFSSPRVMARTLNYTVVSSLYPSLVFSRPVTVYFSPAPFLCPFSRTSRRVPVAAGSLSSSCAVRLTLFITSLFSDPRALSLYPHVLPLVVPSCPACSTYCVPRISGVVEQNSKTENQVQTAGSCERCERALPELNISFQIAWTVERPRYDYYDLTPISPRRGRTSRFVVPLLSHTTSHIAQIRSAIAAFNHSCNTHTSHFTSLFSPSALSRSVIIPKSDEHVLKTHRPVDGTRTRTQTRNGDILLYVTPTRLLLASTPSYLCD